ncbi:GNAT family N-acetyltransferase [Tsukamurella sp. 8F]|uniref:GNAT family N-acetyltransferase n=1 Tax=unclassified Tsukamurella TaxID=2633480 RepID=UPI0023BA1858|nr:MULTISPECIES: GNAT family N-acetyltransferase [unclassified Tsukamurella]MDF0531392.1 GNAT family N-acetyltransferase [Tsukamurella sp. 8J]MDF0585302.1 GNAT family N-acetyltransferase [Tsukamurella sp. 8F]
MDVLTLARADAGELLTLQRAAYVTEAQAHGDLTLPPLTETLDELVTALTAGVTALGIRRDGRLVAAVRLAPASDGTVELGRLVVAPDLQGQGLGSRLLTHALDGAGPVRLFTGERSAANLRLYSRFGFRETHRTPTGNGYDLVHMARV